MNNFAPKITKTADSSTGLMNYVLVWYGRQVEDGISDLLTEAMRSLLPKLLVEDAGFQEKLAAELKRAISSMQAEVLASIIKAAVREAIKEEKA